MRNDMQRRLFAEFFGTFWLVFGGCGSAVIAAGYPQLGIGFTGVAFAFGLTVLSMAYAVGHISGGHFNPRCHARPVGGGSLRQQACHSLRRRPGDRGGARRGGTLGDRVWQA